jgi:hypothetical protein
MTLLQQHGLVVLRISLDRSPTEEDSAVFQLAHDLEDETFAQLKVSCSTLGLPPDMRALRERRYRYREPGYALPPFMIDLLRRGLERVTNPREPLWLLIDSGAGLLPIVPWERLLARRLGRLVLRLPAFATAPFIETGGFGIALIASTYPAAPVGRRKVVSFDDALPVVARALVASLERAPVWLHVFCREAANREWASAMEARIRDGLAVQVRLHDPRRGLFDRLAETGTPENAAADTHNDWFGWVSETLDGDSVDAIHFLCHGDVTDVDGVISLAAPTPGPSPDTVIVGAAAMATFLTQAGAWAAGFTLPVPTHSAAGVRLMVDHLSRIQPGAILVHELARDPSARQLERAYAFLASTRPDRPPATGAIALTTHPQTLAGEHGTANTVNIVPGDNARRLLEAPGVTPSWLASGQRFLEQTSARVLEERADTPEQQAVQEGTQRAVEVLSSLMDKHAGVALSRLATAEAESLPGSSSETTA